MEDVKISICASAIRPKLWGKFLKSLQSNKCPYEVIFAGPVPPHIQEGCNDKLTWIESWASPAESYQMAFNNAQGEIIHYTADDAIYGENCLDNILKAWEWAKTSKWYKKVIMQPNMFENYGQGFKNNTRTQKFNSQMFSPLMAPFGFMSRDWFEALGGYDRNFVTGQAENDICLRAYADGGTVKIIEESSIYVDHFLAHGGVEGTDFSKGYITGRKYLESCWMKDGKLSKKRLKPVEPFTW